MAAVSREEIDAKFERDAAKVDARLTLIDAKLDRILDRVELATTAATNAESRAEEARKAAGSIKWNIAATALGVVAVVIALGAIWLQSVALVRDIYEPPVPPPAAMNNGASSPG